MKTLNLWWALLAVVLLLVAVGGWWWGRAGRKAERLATAATARAHADAATRHARADAAQRAAEQAAARQAEQAAERQALQRAAEQEEQAEQRAAKEAERQLLQARAQAELAAHRAAEAAQAANDQAERAAAAVAPVPPPSPPAHPPAPTPAPPPTRPRLPEETLVMVADDSKVVRVKTSRLLAQHHYRVVLAEDGEQAARLIEDEIPLVLITDVEMPGMDGFALTRHVRRHPRAGHIPIIMITSADERLKDAAAAAGVTLVLGKPYPEEALIACIQQAQAMSPATVA